MIASGLASPAAINSGIWFRRHRESFPYWFSSVSRKSTVYPIEKDLVRSFRAPEFRIVGRVSVHPVVTKVESNNKFDERTQKSKTNDALASVFENIVISGRDASSGAKTSTKEENPERISTNNFLPVIIRYPLGTESAIKAMLEFNTLVFVVAKRADKTIIKDTVEKMFKIRAKKVNTLIMPDGTKKAFVMLARDFNALDVAKRIKIL